MNAQARRNEAEIPADHYLQAKYNGKGRFVSYWHQIDEVLKRDPESLLEVGIGNHLVSDYLHKLGRSLTTADINLALQPDVVSSIEALPFADRTFEMALACEILEHLPITSLEPALAELYRVTYRWGVISVPDCTRCYCYQIHLPRIGTVRRQWQRSALPNHVLIPDHCWELGHGASRQQLVDTCVRVGFKLVTSYRVFEHPYHHFFVLARS